MMEINLSAGSYVCPFCGHAQAYCTNVNHMENGIYRNTTPIPPEYRESSFTIYTLPCNNHQCKKISVVAINRASRKQIDLVPQVTMRHYPDYIPEQIRRDYEETNLILEASPKAAATLLRRCLQGMIHDFWGIREKNLNAEISELKDKVTPAQWRSLDGLRKIGNISAHMEKDVNLIIDIDPDEASKLLKLIELLFEKWCIARHDEEALFDDIAGIAEQKEEQRK